MLIDSIDIFSKFSFSLPVLDTKLTCKQKKFVSPACNMICLYLKIFMLPKRIACTPEIHLSAVIYLMEMEEMRMELIMSMCCAYMSYL